MHTQSASQGALPPVEPPLNERALLGKVRYTLILKMLGRIEAEMYEKVEFYDRMFAAAQRNMKTRKEWDDVIARADADLHNRKYLEAKAREEEKDESRRQKNIQRLEHANDIKPVFGKKRMVRNNLKTRKKEETVKKKETINPDVLKYFGDEIDLEAMG